jgi:carboxyl-terminal processing protease
MFSKGQSTFFRLLITALLFGGMGILLGTVWVGRNRSKEEDLILINSIKFRELLSLIHTDYIDATNTDSLADAALESMVEELDPHSYYISKKEVFSGSIQLESNFEGIGAEFQFIEDTIWVSSVMAESPSEKAGLRSGDKILTVNRIAVSGVNISHHELTNLVRGPKGTPVIVEILRGDKDKTLSLNIIRDRIQSKSLDFVDLIEPGLGYIKCSRFTQTTSHEMREALMVLIAKGAKSLILDLRDNSGGYVSAAIKVSDEFLSDNQLIVYTEGRNPEHNARTIATSSGLFESGNLLVLINENTASAAEIVTGALQDNDRALILGRRSFGKGLVQAPITLTDGSEIRLTISRYFTPSGRCIQKGFQRKKRQAYFKEADHRMVTGELFNKDSIKTNGRPIFKTRLGRKVYGGGGIIPDVFASKDSLSQTEWVSKLVDKPVLYAFILKYFIRNNTTLNLYDIENFKSDFDLSSKDLEDLRAHLNFYGNEIPKKDFEKLRTKFSLYVKAGIAKCLWQYDGFYKVINQKDAEIRKAIEFAPKSKKTLDQMVASKNKLKSNFD